MINKYIIGLLLLFTTSVSYAQLNVAPPLEFKTYTYTYSFDSPELQIDSVFVENLNDAVTEIEYVKRLLFDTHNRYKHLLVGFFSETDCPTKYIIKVELSESPLYELLPNVRHEGYVKKNGYYFWFGKDFPTDLIINTKDKKRFSGKESITTGIFIYDPIIMEFTYDKETGNIENTRSPGYLW